VVGHQKRYLSLFSNNLFLPNFHLFNLAFVFKIYLIFVCSMNVNCLLFSYIKQISET
jgi:hypothetical protein